MRSRCLLHLNKLDDFRRFCEARGWVNEPTRGDYEVLRLRKPTVPMPILVYSKLGAAEHATVEGIAAQMVRAFLGAA